MALASALKDHLRLIVLDLDANDEPQAIFETLNAHGTPLLPADLIKNWLLWEGARRARPLSGPRGKRRDQTMDLAIMGRSGIRLPTSGMTPDP